MTFADNVTRSCVTNCSNGTYGDPVSRNCLAQCPTLAATGTSNYYSDNSTGQFICVIVCPSLPSTFGLNTTNQCVSQCPYPLYGDQTNNRTCVAVCPSMSPLGYFAQNISRICVAVCINGTWGYQSSRECVENAFYCQAQWADNTTNLCVTTCPSTAGTFADPTTKFCVSLCPNLNSTNSTALYFADLTSRTCVQSCPNNVYLLGTFGNNETRTC